MKLTNKQHTDYCEIINNFKCKAIDTLESLTKEYKNTLAEDIDKELNDWKTHNEELIIELNKSKERNKELEKQIQAYKDYSALTIEDIKRIAREEQNKFINKVVQDVTNDRWSGLIYRVKVLEKALELACSTHQFEDTCDYCPYNEERFKTNACPCRCEYEEHFNRDCAINYFIQQAEKELGDKE